MRRANGTGSVYKRPDSEHRRCPWVAVINIGFTDTGKRRKKIIGSFKTHKEAQKALELYNVNPTDKVVQKITWKNIWERVLVERERLNKPVGSSTLNAWKNHTYKIQDLTPQETKTIHLQTIVDSTNSAAIQTRILTAYHMLYEYALANDLCVKDYSRFVKTKTHQKSNMHKPLTTEAMRSLWKDSDNETAKIILIYVYTGLRADELAKMEIKDVDIKNRVMIGGSKTDAGRNRVIPIAKCILPFIKHFYSISLFQKSIYLITPDVSRGLYALRGKINTYRIFKNYFDRKFIPHDTRHTFITMCDNFGIPEKIQKLIVGHISKDNITQNVYTHKESTQLIHAVDMLPYGEEMNMTKIGSQLEATEKNA